MIHSGKDSIQRMASAFDSPPSPQNLTKNPNNESSTLVNDFLVFPPVHNSLEDEIIQILRFC
jgi:hypothetical protein